MKHDVSWREFEVDEQTTAIIMECSICGQKTRPIYRKDEAKEAMEQDNCPGPPKLNDE